MFVKAIEEIQNFTRPVHTIMRYYHNDFIQPGTATLFFVNELGVAITCRHVLDLLFHENNINSHYAKFKEEKLLLGTKKDGHYKKSLKALEAKYNFSSHESIAQLKNMFLDCTDSPTFEFIPHPTLDLTIIKFKDVKQNLYSSYAKFLKDGSQLKQGKSLCRYGFPFPEFTNFEHDKINDEINFTAIGNIKSPTFPIDGILTRHVADTDRIVGIELSTPGLKGQSGGPLFDINGLVCGMQSETVQYHLGFDEQKIEIISKGRKSTTVNHSFLNIGRCIHVDAIKEFLKANNVKFYEE